MKIIRHLTERGPAYAALGEEGWVQPLSGDPFTTGRALPQRVRPGRLLAPLEATAIFGVGLNYRKHAEEMGRKLPTFPLIFMKSPQAVQAPGAPIEIPRALRSDAVDYEGELAVVIGRAAKNVREEDALDYVLGYTLANDVSARDWQFIHGGGQFCQAKSFDTFCPLGPVLVTTDEIPDPSRLHLSTHVNGELRQSAPTCDLIFSVPALISFLSASKTLMPGTVILTGSPGGIGHGFAPPRYLAAGDTVSVHLPEIGTLTNGVVHEGGPVPLRTLSGTPHANSPRHN